MNERLKQIAIKAKVEHCISHVRLEEFAELIIKECAKQAYDYICDNDNQRYWDDVGSDCIPGDTQSHIKEYFGVK